MQKSRWLNIGVRITLFTLILLLGTLGALAAGETRGLAMADLSDVSVQTVATGAESNVLYASVVDGPQASGIYRSRDNGNTWEVVSPGPAVPVSVLAMAPDQPEVLYAGTTGGPVSQATSLWQSSNGGESWHKFALSLPANPAGQVPAVTALTLDPQQPGVLYVGTDGQGVYRFDADRAGYQLLGDLTLYNARVKNVAAGANNQVYALTNDGLFVTRGDRWQQLTSVPEFPVSLAVESSDPAILYVGSASSGVYRSNDGGQSWQAVSAGLGLVPGAALRITALALDQADPQHVAVATAYGLGNRLAPAGIYESANGGASWNKVADIKDMVSRLAFQQGALYASSTQGLVRYGQPTQPAGPLFSVASLRPVLVDPNVTQGVILALTVVLAGLVLIGRLEWLVRLFKRRSNGTSAA